MTLALEIGLGLLPSFTWLIFYLQEGIRPEPKRLIALAFVNGAAFAFLTLGIQLGLQNVLVNLHLSSSSFAWLFIFAASEEVMKFAAAYAAVNKSPDFVQPVDAMLYMVVAALGFAAVENVGLLVGGSPTSIIFASLFHLITFRFIGATLLHTLSSGLVGYYWALSCRHFGKKTYLLWGLFAATALHAAFNYGVLHYNELGLSIGLLMIAGFFVLGDFEKLKPKVV